MRAALNFLTQYEEDGIDLLGWVITGDESGIHFYEPERKSLSMVCGKLEVPRKFKNEWSARQVILTAFWDCCGFVYTEFGPDACKGKRDFTQDIYFDTLMHLRNAIWSKRWGLLSQKVVLIHDSARPHRSWFRPCWKIFIGNSLNSLCTHWT